MSSQLSHLTFSSTLSTYQVQVKAQHEDVVNFTMDYNLTNVSVLITIASLEMMIFTLTHCVSSNVSSNCLLERMQIYTGCICLTFLHYEFSNVSLNHLPGRMQSHIGCICLLFLPHKFSNVSLDRLPGSRLYHTGCIC